MQDKESIHFAVYTEDIGDIAELAASVLGDTPFTVVHGAGIWNGVQEDSAVIHIITDRPASYDKDNLGRPSPSDAIVTKLKELVLILQTENHQETVLIESYPVRAKLYS